MRLLRNLGRRKLRTALHGPPRRGPDHVWPSDYQTAIRLGWR